MKWWEVWKGILIPAASFVAGWYFIIAGGEGIVPGGIFLWVSGFAAHYFQAGGE